MARYKGVQVNSFGIPMGILPHKNRQTEKRYKRIYFRSFSFDFKKNAPRNLLLIYDIPESNKKGRDWFRRQLINFGFIMIQRSVWVGPSPLPRDFNDYIKAIKLDKNFKTFKLAKSYTSTSTL